MRSTVSGIGIPCSILAGVDMFYSVQIAMEKKKGVF
jgi:hypothetical protein